MRLQSLLAALCLLAGLAAYALTPHQHLADLEPVNLEQMIPTEFGEWTMEPTSEAIIASPEQEAFVKSIYSQVLSRTYVNKAGERIMLSIAYTRDQSDNAGTQSHIPEICYPAQGFSIISAKSSHVRTGFGLLPVRELVAQSAQRTEAITYYSTIGERIAITSLDKKKYQIYYGFHNVIPDGLIFRVSSIPSGPIEKEYESHVMFMNDLFQSLSSSERKSFAISNDLQTAK